MPVFFIPKSAREDKRLSKGTRATGRGSWPNQWPRASLTQAKAGGSQQQPCQNAGMGARVTQTEENRLGEVKAERCLSELVNQKSWAWPRLSLWPVLKAIVFLVPTPIALLFPPCLQRPWITADSLVFTLSAAHAESKVDININEIFNEY